jgi:hypothetical protein
VLVGRTGREVFGGYAAAPLWETNPSADWFMTEAVHFSHASLIEAIIKDGQDLKNAAPYINDALFGTSLKIYGDHLERLHEIKKYDPENFMGLAGEWKS